MISRLKQPQVWLPLLVILLVVLAIGLYLFQPWRLFTSTTVNEDLPAPTASSAPSATGTAAAPPAVRELATGSFVDQEHATSGTARIVEVNGNRILRLENLDTSDGPDLHVWLSASTVEPGQAGWFTYDDGAYLALGPLKGNKGNQNYPIPAGADLTDFRTAVIWCDRFNVAFGAAELRPAR